MREKARGWFVVGAAVVLAAGLVGCGGTETPGPDVEAPGFPDGTGQETASVQYPSGPYGVRQGSVIANFKFLGFVNATADTSALQPIQLADFYNPTGEDVYPDGSPYGAGNPKPKALAIDIASVWCGPCNQEAGSSLPTEVKKYRPMGGQFLLNLADGPTPGRTATQANLASWAKKYKEDFPTVIDPEYRLMDLAPADAFPENFIIDTKTMTIVTVVPGVPDASYWTKFGSLLK